MIVHKGEQFSMPFDVKIENQKVTPSNIDGLRIQVGNRLCHWPDGELEYDTESETWLYPLTENQSIDLQAGQRKAEVAVKIGDTILKTGVICITVQDSIIMERWGDDG